MDWLTPWIEYLQQQTSLRKAVEFFRLRLTLLDFLIIALGFSLAFYQIWKRLTTFSKRFYRKTQGEELRLKRVESELQIVSNLIELLPILGILGTVLGIMMALYVIQELESPKIKDIATHIAPALSTTLFGLIFTVINVFLFGFVHAYFSNLIEWARAERKTREQQRSTSQADLLPKQTEESTKTLAEASPALSDGSLEMRKSPP